MRGFDWLKLGGGRRDRSRDRYGGNEASTDQRRGCRDFTTDLLIVLFTGALVVVGWRQAGIMDRQASFSVNEAAASSNAQAASLNVAEQAADANANQAAAMKQMAKAANKQAAAMKQMAGAAEQQAVAARHQAAAAEAQAKTAAAMLQVQNTGQVSVNVQFKTSPGPLEAVFKIMNTGPTTITDAQFEKRLTVVNPSHVLNIWEGMRGDYSRPIGRGETVEIVARLDNDLPLTSDDTMRIMTYEEVIIGALVVKFVNPGQTKPTVARFCEMIEGENFERHPCRY
jgi:hypothetical protein